MNMFFGDLGGLMGYAYGELGACISGEWDLSNSKHEAWAMRGIKLKRRLSEINGIVQIDRVGYEVVAAHKGAYAAHAYGMYMAALQEWCIERGVPFEGVSVGTLKRFATGKGNANKEAMKTAVRERWQVFTDSDNEADAVAGWHWMHSQEGAKLKDAAG